jgi:hypothetical protein
MKIKKSKIKNMDKTVSEINRLVEGLYGDAGGIPLIVINLDRISISVELLKMNIADMMKSATKNERIYEHD